jgi:glycerol-3-phosphate dehydrogenase (NAD(P)+)
VLFVAPAQHVRALAREMRASLRPAQPVVMCAKGIEQSTGQMMGDVLAAELPEVTPAVLSGPSFASDVARGLPAALTIACAEETLGRQLAERLGCSTFRLYWTNDVVGVELGGALKNVLAIAAGIVDGQGLGASAHAALVTRGFAEMRRLGKALGAKPETLIGLSGLGDLILTCGSPQSRNMSLGRALGRGETLSHALAGKLAVTEGVYTATAVRRIAAEKGIEMPICAAVCDVIDGRASVRDAIGQLMQRPLKAED